MKIISSHQLRQTLALIALASMMGSLPTHAKDNVIQCANLIYAGNQTSRCFSDQFLSSIQKKTGIATERRFKSVKLNSNEIFKYPFIMMTGESSFRLRPAERKNLKKYLTNGGFLLASAGCSSKEWDRSFRLEMKTIFQDKKLKKLKMDHPIFNIVNKIKSLELTHGGEPAKLEAIEIDGKAVVIYSPHGLNDTAHTEGCCCCGGNEIGNSMDVNVNILVYSLLH
jgi:hypothetical protein